VTTLLTADVVIGGIAADGNGNLYITDSAHSTVNQIDIATANMTVLAGTSGRGCGTADGIGTAATFCGPEGLAYDGAGNLYVADGFNGTVRKVVAATGVVTTYIGSAGEYGVLLGPLSSARLKGPWGLAVSPAQTLFIADLNENVLVAAH
jgi:NHL repeat